MKLTSVKYLIGNGFKNIWLNKLMSIASIGVLVACMSIIGFAVALSLNIDHNVSKLEKENIIVVYFDDRNAALYAADGNGNNETYNEITEEDYEIHSFEEAILLCAEIEKLQNVASVVYFSNSDILGDALLGSTESDVNRLETWLDSDKYGNPLPCGAKVSLNSMDKFDETLESIEGLKGVESTSSSKKIADTLQTLKHAITIIGFWIIAVLMIISLMIVSNTIRVTMYSRKLEISIMKAVGATDSFVRLPFMIEGVTIGLLSAGITTVILYFVYNAVEDTVKTTYTAFRYIIPFSDFFFIVLGIFVAIGAFAGLFASAIMINKYLRKEGSEFRAL